MNTLDELLLKWREGGISPEELHVLNDYLAHPGNRQRLHDEFVLSTCLKEAVRGSTGATEFNPAHEGAMLDFPISPEWEGEARLMGQNRSGRRWIATVAACAAILGFLLALSVLFLNVRERASIFATNGAVQIERGEEQSPAEPGALLRSGDFLHVADGSTAAISFADGTSIELGGGSRLEVLRVSRQKLFRLHAGSLSARVAPQRKPMIIHTAQAEAVVLGTEFSLSALPLSTRLQVSEGKVRFRRVADGAEVNVQRDQFAMACPITELAVRNELPRPWSNADVGAVEIHGSAFIRAGICRVTGAGRNICEEKDQLHFLYQRHSGDFDFRARLLKLDATSDESRAGLMVRQSLQSACQQVFLAVRGDGKMEVQHREDESKHSEILEAEQLPLWLRVQRKNREISVYLSQDGQGWKLLRREKVDCGETSFVGFAVTSFNNAALGESVFDNVSIREVR